MRNFKFTINNVDVYPIKVKKRKNSSSFELTFENKDLAKLAKYDLTSANLTCVDTDNEVIILYTTKYDIDIELIDE